MKKTIDDKLSTCAFRLSGESHIKIIDPELCGSCADKPCCLCPAECYKRDGQAGSPFTNFDGCLECGTCDLICPASNVDWNYPKGGFGVAYELG